MGDLTLETDRYPDTGFSVKDTSPEINRMIFQHTMSLTGEQRFLMGVRMHEAARDIVLSSLPPGLTEEERKHTLFERMYGQTVEEAVRPKRLQKQKQEAQS